SCQAPETHATFSSNLSSPYFFFHSYGDHRDLHSFPTRRSSDLDVPWADIDEISRTPSGLPLRLLVWGVFSPQTLTLRASGRRLRSEEHTSELQSRGHLVCRLLLEKKKTDVSARPVAADEPILHD